MMTLRTRNLPTTLDTSRHDLTADFFVPLLTHAQRYDRGVGYFSSGWLRLNAAGMVPFAANGGRARWITSPILDTRNWEALQAGDVARDDALLRMALRRNVEVLAATLERDTLSALAWMVADGILTFKLAVPRKDLHGQFHAKFGVFSDAGGNQVSFSGSYNDSIHGTENYEEITVFWSWEAAYVPHIQATVERFERLWNNQDQNVRAFELPEAVREQILQLRTAERPYPEPEWLRLRRTREQRTDYRPNLPGMPDAITLRDYQLVAITAWFAHDCRGLLEMATGTGKTITALAASIRLFGREGRLAVIIAVPYQHLVDQWHTEAQAFGYQPVPAYQRKSDWLQRFNQQVSEYNHGDRTHIAIITTHTTFIDTDFQQTINRITGPALLIADEMHHLGAERSRVSLPASVSYRLGLSATPDRWFDDVGTSVLRDYFGETVFAFSLEQAIGTVLTTYSYYPQLVELTPDEMTEYQNLSEQIGKLINSDDDELQAVLKMLLIKRARMLNNAANKLTHLSQLLSDLGPIDHALFYCAPEQIDDVCRLLGWDHALLIHRFTAEEPNEQRRQLLADFADGQLQGLVAMRCLDEGVDVPSTRIAFILASSSNPREFVQRRGRILRKALGKTEAVIYDLITIPSRSWYGATSFNAEQSIMQHEIQRFREFAESARNKHQALDVIWDIARQYGMYEV